MRPLISGSLYVITYTFCLENGRILNVSLLPILAILSVKVVHTGEEGGAMRKKWNSSRNSKIK